MTERNQTTHIIIHTAAASHDGEAIDQSAETIRRYHIDRLGWSDIGYHYVIRFDGTIEQGRDGELQGAHCRDMNMNERSVGICCSGHGDIKPFTEAQKESVRRLVNDLRQKYEIPVSNVLGHRETGANKTCPGKKVNMNEIRRLLSENDRRVSNIDIERVEKIDVPKMGSINMPKVEGIERNLIGTYDKPMSYYAVPKDNALERIFDGVLETIAGQNKAGKIIGKGKDVVSYFVPFGGEIDALTDQIGDMLKSQTNINTMTNETIFQKIKRRIKQPSTQAGLSLVATVLGSAWIGLDISVEVLTQSALGIVTGAAGIYAGAMSIYEMFRDEDKRSQ